MTHTCDLSIIIVSYNTKELLLRCLRSIYASQSSKDSPSYEIIVIDNGSTDGSREMLKRDFPNVRCICETRNLGFGKANNEGIKKCYGTHCLLLNSDTEVYNGGIKSLWSFAKSHNRAFVGGKLFNTDKSVQPSCGPFFSIPIVIFMLFFKGDNLGISRYVPKHTRIVDWVSGACIIGKVSDFLEVGLFDESIFMYMEEIELLYRAKKKGYTTYFFPDARFMHVGSGSSASRKTPVLNIFRGLLYLYNRHRSKDEVWLLKKLLLCKAWLAIQIGKVTGNHSLVEIYEEASHIIA